MHSMYLPLFNTKPKVLYGTTGGTYSARVFRPFFFFIFTPFVKQINIYIQIFPERMLNGEGHIIVKTN